MKGFVKLLGTGIGYGLGSAGWVGVFAAGVVYGKYQACKKLKTNPEEIKELASIHEKIDEAGDNIVKDLGVL